MRSAGGVAGRVDAIRSIVHSTADRRIESYSGDCDHAADHRKDQGIFRRRRAGFIIPQVLPNAFHDIIPNTWLSPSGAAPLLPSISPFRHSDPRLVGKEVGVP